MKRTLATIVCLFLFLLGILALVGSYVMYTILSMPDTDPPIEDKPIPFEQLFIYIIAPIIFAIICFILIFLIAIKIKK